MQIPLKTLAKWKVLRSGSDVKRLADKMDCTGQHIRNILKTGQASDEMAKGIAEFYKAKLEAFKELA